MRKTMILTILMLLAGALLLAAMLASVVNKQYRGSSRSGRVSNEYASNEYTGRLDGGSAQSQSRRAEETRQYHGGPGAGSAMGQYAGPLIEASK